MIKFLKPSDFALIIDQLFSLCGYFGSFMPNGSSFAQFLEGWLVRQEHYLDELLSVEQRCHELSNEDLKEVISQILAHYGQYYEEKSRIILQNVFLVFSPPWFTPFERSLFWIGGFKPALAFRVLHDSARDLSEDQRQRISMLKEETRVNERLLNDELARLQESVASPPFLDPSRLLGRVARDGIIDNSEIATLASGMEEVVGRADLLRTNTVVKVVEMLDPTQKIKFLTAVTRLQLSIRNTGLQRC